MLIHNKENPNWFQRFFGIKPKERIMQVSVGERTIFKKMIRQKDYDIQKQPPENF